MAAHASPPGRELYRPMTRRLTRVQWAGIGVGLALGVGLGGWYRFLEGTTPSSFLSPTISAIVVGVAVLLFLALSAAILRAAKRTKAISRGAELAAVGLVLALPVGYVVGPTSQPPRDLPGQMDIEITGGTPGSHSGSATCLTIENGDLVMSVVAEGIGTVGGFPLRAELFWLDDEYPEAGIAMTLAGGSDVGGLVAIQEVGANRWTGRASFGPLPVDNIDQDPPGGWTSATGTVSWTCG